MRPISIIFSVAIFAIHISPLYPINIAPLLLDGLSFIGLGPPSLNDQKELTTTTAVPPKTTNVQLSPDTLMPLLIGAFTNVLYSLVSDNRNCTDVLCQYTLDFSGLVDPKKCKSYQVILYVSNSPKIGKNIGKSANGQVLKENFNEINRADLTQQSKNHINVYDSLKSNFKKKEEEKQQKANGKSSNHQQQLEHFPKPSLQDVQKENHNQVNTNDEQNKHQKNNDKVSKHTEKIAGDVSIEIVQDFREDLTNQINMLRIYHGVGVIKLDNQMTKVAQKRANSMANGRLLEKINESVFVISSYLLGKSLEEKLCKKAINKWYEQGENVRYGEKQYEVGEAPDFTRLVWKSSKKIGVGMAQNSTTHKYFVVVYYDYEGDYDKSLNENVLSPWKERTKVEFNGSSLKKDPKIV
ncbi:uncharacterized protein LOC126835887 [Adelges cooleyi]|uniref:uncharacterized protein LOC126835887 n=1 Tax=Adelges cooleyi TaxID=133065 RepID=UPI00217F3B48|nr:uncharacterized protein LOC126835887 [Adelges cooleyi]XP_050424700.1 uncharacterized protein LOC126835887 [Adelges cooleyi]